MLAADPGDRFENCGEFVAAARRALGPVADPRSAGGSPLLRPVSYPAPPHGPVLASALLPAPVPAGYPAEVAHEATGAPGPDGPVQAPPDGPLTPSPGLPDPVLWPVPRREQRARLAARSRPLVLASSGTRSWSRWERPRGWLPALAALVLVAGTTAGVTLSLAGGGGGAAATGSAGAAASRPALTASPAMSAKPSVTTSPSMGATPAGSGSAAMTAKPSMSASPSVSASPRMSASPGKSMAATANNCTKEQPGNGTGGPVTLPRCSRTPTAARCPGTSSRQ